VGFSPPSNTKNKQSASFLKKEAKTSIRKIGGGNAPPPILSKPCANYVI
jgi:hypothetical protein